MTSPGPGSEPPPPAPSAPPAGWRAWFDGRPLWMNAVMVFCFYMACIYVPWDLFAKPLAEDREVWFGISFSGWAAKAAAVPHWIVYALGAWGFWRMKPWMWPWAAAYAAQVAIGMAVWPLLQFDGALAVGAAAVSFVPFALLTRALWNARDRFQPTRTEGAAS